MTKREAVLEALAHQTIEPVPYSADFTQQESAKIAAWLKDEHFQKKLGGYLASAYYSGDVVPVPGRPGYFQDEFGVVWNRNGADKDIGVIEKPIFTEPDLSLYQFPEPDREKLHALFRELQDRQTDCFKIGMFGFSLFERAWTLCGMENLLVYMVSDEAFVEGLLEEITNWNMQVLDIALQYQFDAFHFGDDWGQQRGLIMGPRYWRKYIAPCLKKMYGRVREAGRFVSQHSCGDIEEVFPDLIDMGLNIYQTFQPEIYNVKQVKAQFGNNLTFWGGISTQAILPHGTPEEVREETRRMIAIMNQNGGYIAAPTHSIPGDVPPENVLAMLEVFSQGKISAKNWGIETGC